MFSMIRVVIGIVLVFILIGDGQGYTALAVAWMLLTKEHTSMEVWRIKLWLAKKGGMKIVEKDLDNSDKTP